MRCISFTLFVLPAINVAFVSDYSESCIGTGRGEDCLDAESGLNLLQTKALKLSPASSARIAIEPAVNVPKGFVVKGRTPSAQTIELSFFVKQQNLGELDRVLLDVSDPASASYGKHWSNGAVQKLLAPKAEHLRTTLDHLQSHGIRARLATPNGDVLKASVTAEQAEILLQTKFEAVTHLKTGRVMHRCLGGYTLPSHVAAAIDFVSPTVHLMSPPPPTASRAAPRTHVSGFDKSAKATTTNAAMLNATTTAKPTTTTTSFDNRGVCPIPFSYPTTPKALRSLYSLAGTVAQGRRSKQAVTGFIGNTYNQQNLNDYWALYCNDIICGRGNVGNVGDLTEGTNKMEAMLDVNVITGVAGNVYTEFWGFDTSHSEEDPFVKWLIKVSDTSDDVIPKVFSTSYGEDEGASSPISAARLNIEFQKAGLRGISILFASGDEGANLAGKKFRPEFPSSSPYVTSVGATAPAAGFPRPGSETATALSSGGFSNFFPMPSWQNASVRAYLQRNGLPNITKYSVETAGRAYPDISAQGYSYCVTPQYIDGVFGCLIGGTSAATPAVSGIISLLNDLRAGMGKSPLGFLNPLIYKYPEAFNDIKSGYNTLNGKCTSAPAWPATEGWDAVTGHGTPNYAKLASIVSMLP